MILMNIYECGSIFALIVPTVLLEFVRPIRQKRVT